MTSQLELLGSESAAPLRKPSGEAASTRIDAEDKEAGRRGIAEARAVLARAQAAGRVVDVRIIRDVA